MEFCLLLDSTNCWLCFVCFRLKDYDQVVLAIEIVYYLGMLRIGWYLPEKQPGEPHISALGSRPTWSWPPMQRNVGYHQKGSSTSGGPSPALHTHDSWCSQPSGFCGSIIFSDLNWLFIERNPWTSYVGKSSSHLGDGDTNYGAMHAMKSSVTYWHHISDNIHVNVCGSSNCVRFVPFHPKKQAKKQTF